MQAGTDVGDSALGEIGNILGTSYLNALAAMTGLSLLPCPPHLTTDLLAAIVATLLAQTAGEADMALVLDSELNLAEEPCTLSFLMIPTSGSISDLLAPLGPRREHALSHVGGPDGRAGCVVGRRARRSSRSASAPASVWRCSTARPEWPDSCTSCCPSLRTEPDRPPSSPTPPCRS